MSDRKKETTEVVCEVLERLSDKIDGLKKEHDEWGFRIRAMVSHLEDKLHATESERDFWKSEAKRMRQLAESAGAA